MRSLKTGSGERHEPEDLIYDGKKYPGH